ncbi:MAG: hypothetical protein IPO69_17450 [Saprospiraceae bacterium]|nr:hypothetical protein [Saprospiraceae bacterium]
MFIKNCAACHGADRKAMEVSCQH